MDPETIEEGGETSFIVGDVCLNRSSSFQDTKRWHIVLGSTRLNAFVFMVHDRVEKRTTL